MMKAKHLGTTTTTEGHEEQSTPLEEFDPTCATSSFSTCGMSNNGTTIVTATSDPLLLATVTQLSTTRVGLRQHIPIKKSLHKYGTDIVMIENPWLLTAISLGHYLLYPLGISLAWYLFSHVTQLQQYVIMVGAAADSSSALLSVFLLLMGHLMSAWGTAMAGTTVHETEDWQVAELAAAADVAEPDTVQLSSRVVDASHSNNPQLYSVAYTMLLGSVAMGNLCVSAAVFDVGHNIWMQGWLVTSILGYFLASDEPFCVPFWNFIFTKSKLLQGTGFGRGWNQLTDNGTKQFFRVSAIKFHGIFVPNALLCAAALVRMFGSSAVIPIWIAPLPLLLSSLGGIWEGLVAETTLDQRHHLIAVVFICAGYVLYFPLYGALLAQT
jgi:hypothetical protein